MFQEPCRVHTGRWALPRLSFLPVQHLRTWESSHQAAPQTSPKRRFYKILPILWARKGYPSVLHLCVELIKKHSCPAWPYLLRWGAELNKKWQWQCTRLLKISPLLNNSTPPCTHVFMLRCTHIAHMRAHTHARALRKDSQLPAASCKCRLQETIKYWYLYISVFSFQIQTAPTGAIADTYLTP